MPRQNNRNEQHAAIALAIKSSKKLMFKRSREGMDLREAAERFTLDISSRLNTILKRNDDITPPASSQLDSGDSVSGLGAIAPKVKTHAQAIVNDRKRTFRERLTALIDGAKADLLATPGIDLRQEGPTDNAEGEDERRIIAAIDEFLWRIASNAHKIAARWDGESTIEKLYHRTLHQPDESGEVGGYQLLTDPERDHICKMLAAEYVTSVASIGMIAALLSHLNAISLARGSSGLEIETTRIERQLFISEPDAVCSAVGKLEKRIVKEVRKSLPETDL